MLLVGVDCWCWMLLGGLFVVRRVWLFVAVLVAAGVYLLVVGRCSLFGVCCCCWCWLCVAVSCCVLLCVVSYCWLWFVCCSLVLFVVLSLFAVVCGLWLIVIVCR